MTIPPQVTILPTNIHSRIVIYNDINLNFTIDNDPFIVNNVLAINKKIINLLQTTIGSRPWEPTFGSRVPDLLFDPVDDITAWELETAIFDAIQTWLGTEIQLDLTNTLIIPDKDNGEFLARIAYIIKKNNVVTSIEVNLSPNNNMSI